MHAALHALRTSLETCDGLFQQLGAGPEAARQLARTREQLGELELETAQTSPAAHRAH